MLGGPVQAVFRVNPDFFLYRSGVYVPFDENNLIKDIESSIASEYHSVKILGWGIENEIPYWV